MLDSWNNTSVRVAQRCRLSDLIVGSASLILLRQNTTLRTSTRPAMSSEISDECLASFETHRLVSMVFKAGRAAAEMIMAENQF